jgi:hypothetical protein
MTPFAKLDVGPNHAIRTDLAGGMYFALRIDDRRRMNRHFPEKWSVVSEYHQSAVAVSNTQQACHPERSSGIGEAAVAA